MRGCAFDKATGVGAFGVLPLTDAISSPAAVAGLRYSSPQLSVGLAAQPFKGQLTSLWAVSLVAGSICVSCSVAMQLGCWVSRWCAAPLRCGQWPGCGS